MKKKLLGFVLVALTVGLLGSCSKINERLDGIDERIDGIENEDIASINKQVAAINSSISDLSKIRTDIQGLIDGKKAQGEDISALKDADTALGKRIDELKAYVGDLERFAGKTWVEQTFATLKQHEWTCDEIARIDARIGSLDEKLAQEISKSAESLKTWVNSQLSAYYTAAQVDAILGELKSQLDTTGNADKAKIEELTAEIAETKTAVDTAKANIRAEYQAAIESAITNSEGKLTAALQDSIAAVNGQIEALTGRVNALEDAVAVLTGRIDALEAMIQTVSIIPAYNDGSVEALDGVVAINCIVEPATAIAGLQKDSLKVLVNEVKTKAASFETISVSKLIKDEENGTVTVKADISASIPESEGKALTVAVKIASGISKYTTAFVPVTVTSSGLPKGSLYGEFSVSAGKKVHFSKGNVYYDGKDFQFEANQFDAVSAWDASHIGHFCWSKDALVAVAESYDEKGSGDDAFFTNESETSANAEFTVASVAGGFRNLSKDEWTYLLDTRANAETLKKIGVSVCGKENCLVIAPDGFAGEIAESYDEEAWDAAEEEGLVCIPAAGLRYGNEIGGVESVGYYWTSSAADYFAARNIGFDASTDPFMMSKGRDQQKAQFQPAALLKSLQSQPVAAGKSQKAQVRNGNNVQVQKLPRNVRANHKSTVSVKPMGNRTIRPTANSTELTATEYYYDNYYYDVYLQTEMGVFIFEMLNGDPELDHTYTLEDMAPEWTGLLDDEGYLAIRASAATLTLTENGGSLKVVGTMTLDGADYTITYQFAPSGKKIDVKATNYKAEYYSYYGEYAYSASNADYTSITIWVFTESELGTFDEEVEVEGCYLQLPSSEYITFHSVASPIVVAQDSDGNKSLTGSLYDGKGDEYVFNLTYEKPAAKEINVAIKDASLNTRTLAAGTWSIEGQTADKINSASLYIVSKSLKGKFGKNNLENYYTWVSDKSSGTNVYYENVSAAELTSEIVADSLVVEGTLNLASNSGEDAIVTLHISAPFTQTWGEWDDFAPFDMNTGKFEFTAAAGATQAKIPVKVRKDNTGLKQYKFEGWGKDVFTDEGIDLLVDMAPDYTCTVAEQSTGLYQSTYREYIMVSDLNTYTESANYTSKYDPETGVFKLPLIYYISLGQFGYGYETMTMDHVITQRDTVNVVCTGLNYNDAYLTSNKLVIYYTNDAEGHPEGFNLFRVASDKATSVEGTFSWADGTINNANSYFTLQGNSTKQYFQDGEFTVDVTDDTTTIKGWMIGIDEKYYRLNLRSNGTYRYYGFPVRLITETE